MHNLTSRPSNFSLNSGSPVQEAQNRSIPVPSPAAMTPIVQILEGPQRPLAMPSMQAQLVHQWEAGTSNQSRQENVRHPAAASASALSSSERDQLDLLNQFLLAEFRRKADADPENTSLTKDYCSDVLTELADWLQQQSTYPAMRSLMDLLNYVCDDNHRCIEFIARGVEKDLIASGLAPVRMGKSPLPHRAVNLDFGLVIEALNLSRYQPHITLPPAFASRDDERLLHSFQITLVAEGKHPDTAANFIAAVRHFYVWLQRQAVLGIAMPHGLGSLVKLVSHPDGKQVKEVVDCYRIDPDTSKALGDQARTGINRCRNLMGQSSMPVGRPLRAQPMLQSQRSARPTQPANLAPPRTPSLGGSAVVAEARALPDAASAEAGSSRYGVWRPVPRSQDASRKVQPRVEPAQPEQPANLAPPHTPSLGGSAVVAEARALPDAASAEAGSSRYGVWRPVPRSQHASRNVRPRVELAQPEQSPNLVPPHGAGMAKPGAGDEELAFLVGPDMIEDEFDFLNNLFK